MPLSPHTRLGPYEILSAIGAGGMGEVYKARDTRLDRTVAIKVLLEHRHSSPQARERFEREAKAISSLSHPHICTLHDVGHQDGIDYIVMEYLDGQTLADRLKKGSLPLEQVLQYAIQITDALSAAHRQGVIHRDLKPGNIMLTKAGLKLLDFGLAKVRSDDSIAVTTVLPTQSTPLTGEGTILGTLPYMAPEQLEGKEADARTDIFALGALIYEMATGRKAFAGESQASLISAIMTSEPPSIATLQSMAPPALDHVARTCLAKDPDVRWQTAHDVLIELQWIAQASAEQAPSRRARVPFLFGWIAAIVFGSLLLAVALVHFREKVPQALPLRFSIFPPEQVKFANLNFGPPLISPDGSRLVFVALDDAGNSQLWVRALDALAAQPLAGTAKAKFPFWSPDGRYVAFFADGKLRTVSISGGPPQTVCDAPDGRGGSWGRATDGGAGDIVFAPDQFVPLSRVSARGGDPVQVTVLDSSRQEISHRQPEFLPDGRHFLFVGTDTVDLLPAVGRRPNTAIFVGDLQAKPDLRNVHRLMKGDAHVAYALPGYLLFVRDNNLMAQSFDPRRLEFTGDPFAVVEHVQSFISLNTSDFSVSANGVLAWRSNKPAARQLAWFDRGGKQIEGLDARDDYFRPLLSPDASRIAVIRADAAQAFINNIWILDVVRGSTSRFTFGTGFNWSPVWSPDGRRIVFGVDKPSGSGLYWKDAAGTVNEELLLKAGSGPIPTDWSRDGRFIIFTQTESKTQSDIWVLPLTGDRKPVPILQTEFKEAWGRLSFDGRWLAYGSDESGRFEIYVRSFAEGGTQVAEGKWQVSTAGGVFPRWRPDGKELFFQAPDGKLMAVTVKTGSTFEAGVPLALFDTHDPSGLFSYDVSHDGKRFLISRALERGAVQPVNVSTNWLASVK